MPRAKWRQRKSRVDIPGIAVAARRCANKSLILELVGGASVMRCPRCNSENPAPGKFCVECGAAFESLCPKCGAQNPPASKFCAECGTRIQVVSKARAPAASVSSTETGATSCEVQEVPEGERKSVTALFADIRGSTELMRDLDPEQARLIVDPVLHVMMDAVHRYYGYVAQSTGDGIFALFGAPAAHEDHPQRALYAALRMQEESRKYADRLRSEGKPPLQVRVGANTGEAVVRSIRTGEGHA